MSVQHTQHQTTNGQEYHGSTSPIRIGNADASQRDNSRRDRDDRNYDNNDGGTTIRIDYDEPQSVHEAVQRKLALGVEIQNICVQLSKRDRRHPDGKRFTDRQMDNWRQSAMRAKICKEEELRRVKMYLMRNGHIPDNIRERPTTHTLLLAAIARIMDKLEIKDELRDRIGEELQARWPAMPTCTTEAVAVE